MLFSRKKDLTRRFKKALGELSLDRQPGLLGAQTYKGGHGLDEKKEDPQKWKGLAMTKLTITLGKER